MNNPYIKSLSPIFKKPKLVFVNEDKLKEVAGNLRAEEFFPPSWKEQALPDGDYNTFIDFLGIDSSINFCFTNPFTKKRFQVEYKGEISSGYFAMLACLKRALEEGVPILDCKWLKKVTIEQMEHIFRGINPISLIKERTLIFQEVGEVLERKYGGHFYNLFEEAGYVAFAKDKTGIVNRLITDFPSFFDFSWHEPSQSVLEFHKRAQLFAITYQNEALLSNGRIPLIFDADDLGPPADYRVPQVLKGMGILSYKRELRKKIARQKIIKRDSLEEQEIRAQMTYVMARLCELTGSWIGPIDYRIWYAGTKLNGNEPHHLTPTTAY